MGKASVKSLTIVLKLGTTSIVSEDNYQPRLSCISAIVETVVSLKKQGHKIIIVSSGAVGTGLQRMNMKSRPSGLPAKQALAAIGQGRLIALWDSLFAMFEQPIAQVLLTREDVADRNRYLNAVNTFNELLHMGVIPIVNENDTVAASVSDAIVTQALIADLTQEIRFGDNDTLSAITAAIVKADYLFLLTDVDCLYTDNPRRNPNATAIGLVDDIAALRKTISTSTMGSALGTGGMETKIIAADLATSAGVTTVISSSAKPQNIPYIISHDCGDTNLPLHTVFTAKPIIKDKQWWLVYGLVPAGSIIIDMGAWKGISKKDGGGRLLPGGVVSVQGKFSSGQGVRILVERIAGDEDSITDVARGSSFFAQL